MAVNGSLVARSEVYFVLEVCKSSATFGNVASANPPSTGFPLRRVGGGSLALLLCSSAGALGSVAVAFPPNTGRDVVFTIFMASNPLSDKVNKTEVTASRADPSLCFDNRQAHNSKPNVQDSEVFSERVAAEEMDLL